MRRDEKLVRCAEPSGPILKPTGCCIDSSYDLKTGSNAEMNHKVDHIMTSAPKQVKLLQSKVTGRSKTNGYWDSDHAGLFSVLNLLR